MTDLAFLNTTASFMLAFSQQRMLSSCYTEPDCGPNECNIDCECRSCPSGVPVRTIIIAGSCGILGIILLCIIIRLISRYRKTAKISRINGVTTGGITAGQNIIVQPQQQVYNYNTPQYQEQANLMPQNYINSPANGYNNPVGQPSPNGYYQQSPPMSYNNSYAYSGGMVSPQGQATY